MSRGGGTTDVIEIWTRKDPKSVPFMSRGGGTRDVIEVWTRKDPKSVPFMSQGGGTTDVIEGWDPESVLTSLLPGGVGDIEDVGCEITEVEDLR